MGAGPEELADRGDLGFGDGESDVGFIFVGVKLVELVARVERGDEEIFWMPGREGVKLLGKEMGYHLGALEGAGDAVSVVELVGGQGANGAKVSELEDGVLVGGLELREIIEEGIGFELNAHGVGPETKETKELCGGMEGAPADRLNLVEQLGAVPRSQIQDVGECFLAEGFGHGRRCPAVLS